MALLGVTSLPRHHWRRLSIYNGKVGWRLLHMCGNCCCNFCRKPAFLNSCWIPSMCAVSVRPGFGENFRNLQTWGWISSFHIHNRCRSSSTNRLQRSVKYSLRGNREATSTMRTLLNIVNWGKAYTYRWAHGCWNASFFQAWGPGTEKKQNWSCLFIRVVNRSIFESQTPCKSLWTLRLRGDH